MPPSRSECGHALVEGEQRRITQKSLAPPSQPVVNSQSSMKLVFSSPDSAEVGLAQSRLEAAGIACEVRNDAVSQINPGVAFMPELWVLRDEDYADARRLLGLAGPANAAMPE